MFVLAAKDIANIMNFFISNPFGLFFLTSPVAKGIPIAVQKGS